MVGAFSMSNHRCRPKYSRHPDTTTDWDTNDPLHLTLAISEVLAEHPRPWTNKGYGLIDANGKVIIHCKSQEETIDMLNKIPVVMSLLAQFVNG